MTKWSQHPVLARKLAALRDVVPSDAIKVAADKPAGREPLIVQAPTVLQHFAQSRGR
jgi:hypothetical protein